jgi:glc operon protein GlcG
MMPDVISQLKLTHEAALRVLHAAMAKATELGVPQCVTVVDEAGHLLAFVRMTGARFLSIDSSLNKARAAASSRRDTLPRQAADAEIQLAVTTGGKNVTLLGGVPIIVDGQCVGAVGVGSGTGEQDREVALAAVRAVAGAKTEFG